jgi:diguanylate cyclase (GGDEF)-like protein
MATIRYVHFHAATVINRETPETVEDSYDDDQVEEIVLGLPAEGAPPAGVDDVVPINRTLLSELRSRERALLDCGSVDLFFSTLLGALRHALGCRHLEIWLHDPVGELEMAAGDRGDYGGAVRLMADSSLIHSLYEDGVRPFLADALRAVALEAVPDDPTLQAVWVVPMLQQGQLVGSLHLADCRVRVQPDSLDAELVQDFIQLIPSMLQRVIEYERLNSLMLLDPVTQCANRAGLSREIQREILRCRRSNKVLAVVALTVCGLEMMDNLSQRHIRARMLRQVASHIESALRATDYMGRLSESTFAMLVVDAPADIVPAVAKRIQQDLNGTVVEDGVGGMIELEVSLGHAELRPDQHTQVDSSRLADLLLECCMGAADCELGTLTPRETELTLPEST